MLEAVALPIVKWALSEDVGTGDITTLNTLPATMGARGAIMARATGVLAGSELARLTFRELDPTIVCEALVPDGAPVEPGMAVVKVFGPAGSILTGERTALNFMQRLSGIATLTHAYVAKVAGTRCRILDTRKTTPGLRYLEKYAVKMGGGENHRFALWDMYLVKDNHIRAAGGVTAAIDRIMRTRQDVPLEVEVESLDQLREALRPGVDRILIDNRSIEEVRAAVAVVDAWCKEHPPDPQTAAAGARRWPEVEVSGGVNLETVRAFAETGVDYVSVGALTHSAPALDLSLEIEDVG
ncbi:MAG: carboxylating nicotinate-nucleotide diphosphorylase [Candidatus Eisenbacteria bacterium]